jgi:hypothetical protein
MLNAFKAGTIMKSKVLQSAMPKRLEQVETKDVSTSFREEDRLTDTYEN